MAARCAIWARVAISPTGNPSASQCNTIFSRPVSTLEEEQRISSAVARTFRDWFGRFPSAVEYDLWDGVVLDGFISLFLGDEEPLASAEIQNARIGGQPDNACALASAISVASALDKIAKGQCLFTGFGFHNSSGNSLSKER